MYVVLVYDISQEKMVPDAGHGFSKFVRNIYRTFKILYLKENCPMRSWKDLNKN